jgi:isoamylase
VSPVPGPRPSAVRVPVPPRGPGLAVDADGNGVFAVAAPRAEAVDLCIRHGVTEHRTRLRHVDGGLHWDHVTGMRPGTVYGLRAHGPWDPGRGSWANPAKVLLDPYAHGVTHASPLLAAMFPHEVDAMLEPIGPEPHPSDVDDAEVAVWSVVTHDHFDWQDDAPPAVPWQDTVLYELHVRGYTARHPDLHPSLRGTYAGLARPEVITHLQELGVTTVELLPIHAMMDEPHLTRRGRSNYWGYSTLSFMAPNPAYATAAARAAGAQAVLDEVRTTVRALHRAGIEVVLDVVYNHTAEGGADGPTLSFRGLDAAAYYWLNEGTYVDVTGTGATFDPRAVHTTDLILASLRFWVQQVHVDGFRFDLAATLGRDDGGFRPDHPLLRAITTDPVLRGVKLVAEPWDVGGGGWQTGNFPVPFAEWNDAFRDAVRSFWLADRGTRARTGDGSVGGVRDLATRLAGSRDLLTSRDPSGLPEGRSLRAPWASVNLVTSHDGFTLQDLVSYDHKHNLANGEDNRDGTDDNRSWNHGHEGPAPADAPDIEVARERTARSLLATLLLASGTPMLTAGDEFGRTQGGNNNAYCQDDATSWVDWSQRTTGAGRLTATRDLVALRRAHPELRSGSFLAPADPSAPARGQVAWFSADGEPMRHQDWLVGRHVLQMLVYAGSTSPGLLLVLSSSLREVEVVLPAAPWLTGPVRVVFDAAAGPDGTDTVRDEVVPRLRPDGRTGVLLPPGSVLVLECDPEGSAHPLS